MHHLLPLADFAYRDASETPTSFTASNGTSCGCRTIDAVSGLGAGARIVWQLLHGPI